MEHQALSGATILKRALYSLLYNPWMEDRCENRRSLGPLPNRDSRDNLQNTLGRNVGGMTVSLRRQKSLIRFGNRMKDLCNPTGFGIFRAQKVIQGAPGLVRRLVLVGAPRQASNAPKLDGQ